MGRPSSYDVETADRICELLIEGNALRAICQDDGMPSVTSVMRWLDANEDFRKQYTRARELQGDLMDEKVLSVADSSSPETAHSDRVKIDAYKWRAAHLRPKVYGLKQQLEHTGAEGGPLIIKWADAPKEGK